jgi:hypothetical protein
MAKPGRTQKQIAERYKGNLGYYKRLHPWRRARLIVSLLTLFGGLVVIAYFYKRTPEKFFNPGPLSADHAGLPQNCDECHDKSLITSGRLNSRQFKEIVWESFRRGAAFNRIERIDKKCEACHLQRDGRTHTFHEVNIADNQSCSACHQEHRGPGPMKMVTSSQCASCHNNSAIMAASAEKKMPVPWTPLRRHPQPPQKVVFDLPRPEAGYTQTFPAFWEGHPEFQINVARTAHPEKIRDPDPLRFNHQRHFAGDVPGVDKNGRKLDCNYCHKPETEGRFMRRVTFQANCQACHQLQFDLKNPELTLPHGDATAVLGFLRALSTHYEDLAKSKGLTSPGQIRTFVEQQRRQLRAQFSSDQDLIHSVFFTADPYKPQQQKSAPTRANFTGCAFCHEVKPAAIGAPTMTKPILIDRWMLQSDFNHAKHEGVSCETCHSQARQSRETSDILMPVKASCIVCHSPKGKVAADCMTCHEYHAAPGIQTTVAAASPAPPMLHAMEGGSTSPRAMVNMAAQPRNLSNALGDRVPPKPKP